jgi:hypothetical protein
VFAVENMRLAFGDARPPIRAKTLPKNAETGKAEWIWQVQSYAPFLEEKKCLRSSTRVRDEQDGMNNKLCT